MDEGYLEWLRCLPGLSGERARRVADRFPTFEHLRAASREEILSVPGVSTEDAEVILRVLRNGGRDEEGFLFLCPECGSFAGSKATECPVCGVQFEEPVPSSLVAELETFLADEERPARLCATCGASMEPGRSSCEVCGRTYGPEEAALLPGMDAIPDEATALCPHCGAYLSDPAGECAICGRCRVPPGEVAANGHNGKGITRGFLSRWQRVVEGTGVDERDRLQEELENLAHILETDPNLERAWARKGRLLAELGRTEDAAKSLAKAAELSPEKDEEYRLEVLNLLRASGDMSFLPPRWSSPAATASPPAVDPRLLDALRHYEELLRTDPSLAVAWRTKGEILGRLGRPWEASEALAHADALEGEEDRRRSRALEGFQSPAARDRRTLGLGHVNGRGTGRVNGRINGLANGRVNGLTNGAINGLTLGRGATNGLGGRLEPPGRTNGLVNGNGFTNGRRGRYGPARVPVQPHWARSLVGIAAIVLLMVLAPILASLLAPTPSPVHAFRIDGDFSDWTGIASYVDSPSDQVANPDVNLVEMRLAARSAGLFAYAQVQGLAFRGLGSGGADALYAFVDEDGDPATGYPVEGLGADLVGEVFGWDGAIQGRLLFSYNRTSTRPVNDWNRFELAGRLEAAAAGQQVEILVPAAGTPQEARVLLYAADNRGNRDPADGTVRPGSASVIVESSTAAPDVIPGPTAAILRVALAPSGGPSWVYAVNVSRSGTSSDPATLGLYEDDGDGALGPGDRLVSQALLSGARASLVLNESLVATRVLWVESRWTNVTAGTTFGLRVDGIWTDGCESLGRSPQGLSYLVAAPAAVTVDGAFADWSGRVYGADLLGDVVNRTGSPEYNANVDLLAVAVDVAANFTAYARVDGRVLAGEDLPLTRKRTTPSITLDTDFDTVPDSVEVLLGTGLDRDFNNDNLSDASTSDVDGDGTPDWPGGPDQWLNTTIPSWYPAPYASRNVSRYVGPIAVGVQEGTDVLYAYVDADNSTATGLRSQVDGEVYGFDWALAILGRGGRITSQGLYAYAPGSAMPWRFNRSVDAALDAQRVEFGVNASALGLLSGYRVAFAASDWRLGRDEARPEGAPSRFPVSARVDATTVVINEVSPQPNPEWIELANPTASAVSLAGWDLALVRGKKVTVVYTFTTEVIGAWGSGSEYLVAIPSSNSVPNGNNEILLRQNGVVVDRTTYTASAGSGRSWARFKDPISGVPMDSGNDAADFYVSLVPSPGRGNDRHGPLVVAGKTSSRGSAGPGDLVTYTVYYNNTGTGLAKTVWVNDTLPAGVTFVSASLSPTSVAGSTYGWTLSNVAPGTTNALTITVQVNGNGADGSVQVNTATVDYTDQLRRPMPSTQAWANLTVVRPTIQVVKTASTNLAQVGDAVTFTIYYNNTGSAPAGTVSIRDTLPSGLNLTGSSPAPTWTDGRTLYWNFTNVAPGNYSLTFTAVVTPAANGTNLVNWAFLNYTATSGYALPGSSSSVVVAVPELADFLFVLAVPCLILVLRQRSLRKRREKKEGVADSAPGTGGR